MSPSRKPHPLKILILATIFVAGNLGLPAADVFLGHRLGQENEARVHLERLGGCRNHAEHCVLSRLLNDLRQQSPSSAITAAYLSASTPALPSADHRSASRQSVAYTQSRAPPAPQL